jgi:hypothetical protein
MYTRPHLSDKMLDDWLKPIKAKKTVWVFDACFSGGLVQKGRKGIGDVPIAADQPGAVMENRSAAYFTDKILVASSAADEPSLELTGHFNHGLFTYFFSEGFKPSNGDLNQDGAVTLLEAFEWSSVRVQDQAKQLKRRQTPQITGEASGVFLAGSLKQSEPVAVIPPTSGNGNTGTTPPASDSGNTGTTPPTSGSGNPEVAEPAPSFTSGTVPPVLQDAVPANQTVVQNPATSTVTPAEPPPAADPDQAGGDVILYTTIFESNQAGPTSMDPQALLRRNKLKGTRNIRVALSGQEKEVKIQWLDREQLKAKLGEDLPLGDHYNGSARVKNRVAMIEIKGVPSGVHQITIAADGYPVIMERLGVEKNKNNKIFIPASLSGYGSIQGKVFLKNFDSPLKGQDIWMPTVKAPNMIHRMKTATDGSFWFLNLPPGSDYFLKPGFGSDQPLDDKTFTVTDGQVTKIDVVLKDAMQFGK